MTPAISPPKVTRVSFDNEDTSDLRVNVHYEVHPSATKLRLIVVSKPVNNSDPFNEIEHYTDLLTSKTDYELTLGTKYFRFVLEQLNVSGVVVSSLLGTDLDLTNLPSRPVQTFFEDYRNSIVLTTNIDSRENIFRKTEDNSYSFKFVVDLFNLETSTSLLKTLSNKDGDVVLDGNFYRLHLCDLPNNTDFLIVYHVEYEIGDVTYVSKDSEELARSTTDEVATVQDLAAEYFPTGRYPDPSSLLDPSGIRLTWNKGSVSGDPLYDPNCPEEINDVTRFKVERKYGETAYILLKDDLDNPVEGSTTNFKWEDSSNLVPGRVYTYKVTVGVYNTVTEAVSFSGQSYTITAPFAITPNALQVTFADSVSCDEGTTHHIYNDVTSGIDLNWTKLETSDLHGYIIKDSEIFIDDAGTSRVTVHNNDQTVRFTGLSNGTTYTKTFSYQTEIDSWYALTQPNEPPYHSPETVVTFIPYGDLSPVTNLSVSFDPLYTAFDELAQATVTWTAPADSGLLSDIVYYVQVSKTLTGTVVVPSTEVSTTSYECELTPGFNYTFRVYAQQRDVGCDITVASLPEFTTGDALRLSSAVQSLSVNYKTRNTTYALPNASSPVTAWDTEVSDISKIYISGLKPVTPSWDDESDYHATFVNQSNSCNNPIQDERVGQDSDSSSTSMSLFSTSISDNYIWDTYGMDFADNATYNVTVTPKIVDHETWEGADATTTFTYYELPQVTEVDLVVNRNNTMTVSWNKFTNSRLYFDLFLKTDTADPVFLHRIDDDDLVNDTFTIYKLYDSINQRSLVSGTTYQVYVRAWRQIGSVAYISNTVASDAVLYFEDVGVEIPTSYFDKIATVTSLTKNGSNEDVLGTLQNESGNDLTMDIAPVVTFNGLDPEFVYYKLQVKSALTKGFNRSIDSTSSVFDTTVVDNSAEWADWNPSGESTKYSSTAFSSIPLTKLGYYMFRVVITSYKNPNTGGTETVSIASNETDFFVIANPIILYNSITTSFNASNVCTVQATVYNQWSNVINALGVIVPNNKDKYTKNTLNQWEFSGSFSDLTNTNQQKKTFYLYSETNNLIQTLSFTFSNVTLSFRPIQKIFINVNNGVGLDTVFKE
jgi:hypothetical protein